MAKKLIEADIAYLSEAYDSPELLIGAGVRSFAEEVATLYESEAGKADGWLSEEISWKELRRTASRDFRKLGEANPASAFGQLFRIGVQLRANAWYKRYPTTFQEIVAEVGSTNRQEFHAPLFGAAWPREVKSGVPFKEGKVKGQDIEIINRKFGAIEAFERELFDDDQTSQISQRQRHLGESMKMWQDAYFSRRFVGAADTSYPEAIAASGWSGENSAGTTISTPFSTTMYTAARGNRPSSFVQLTYGAIITAKNALKRAVDPTGLPIVVTPDTLLVSTEEEENAKILLTSAIMPGVPGKTGETLQTATSGIMRGIGATNTLQGAFKLVTNIHLKPWVWALGMAGQGFVNQTRDPLEIVQEVPNSGDSFNYDTIRFRSRARWEMDWVDPRFWYLGNDGTTTGAQ